MKQELTVPMTKIPYYNKQMNDYKNKMIATASMDTEDIIKTAYAKTQNDVEKSALSKASKMILPATILSVAGASAAKAKGASAKLATGALTLASYGIFHGLFKLSSKASEKLTQKDPDRNRAGHINFFAGVGGAALLSGPVYKAINKGINGFAQKMPHTVTEIIEKANSFDKKVAGNKVVNTLKKAGAPIKAFADKFPKIASFATKHSSTLLILAGGISSIAASFALSNKAQKAFNDNIQTVANDVEDARKSIQMLSEAEADYNTKFPNDEFSAQVEFDI